MSDILHVTEQEKAALEARRDEIEDICRHGSTDALDEELAVIDDALEAAKAQP